MFIAEFIGLHQELKLKIKLIVSVPTGLVTTGLIISSTSIELNGTTNYGYMDSLHQYVIFIGIVMFYGTVAPELFASLRGRFKGAGNSG